MTDSDRSLRQPIAIAPTSASAGFRRRTSGGRVWAAFQRDRAAATSLFFLLFVILATLAAPWISPSDPYDAVNSLRNAPPGTPGFLLGADSDGRDVLSRLIWGGRISLTVGVVPSVSAMLISLLLGTVTGYFGGWVDQIVMRVLDVFFAFPLVLLAIAIAGAFEPGLVTEILAIMIVLVPYISRLVRSSTVSVKELPFIEAAKAGGATPLDILVRYVLPNILTPVIAYTTTLIGLMIVVGSGLSFLGLGIQPPAADWGTMVSDGRVALKTAPHITIFPGILIGLVSLAFNFLGDGLTAMLDPRARRGQR
jgi:ABC-type dipeptide/oligopeptide/nickel transport system permease subunit